MFCFLLLIAFAGTEDPVAQPDLDDEVRSMPGAGFRRHDVARSKAHCGLGDFLEVGLGVGNRMVAFQLIDFRFHESEKEGAGGEQALIQKYRAHDGFKGLREQPSSNPSSGLDLAATEIEQVTEADSPGDASKGLSPDEGRAHGGQLTLRRVREAIVEVLRHDQADDRITKVFQSFVGSQVKLGILVEVGPMNE